MEWLDWKLRWLTQEVLNWGGLKFGWTKRGCLIQILILWWLCYLYGLFDVGFNLFFMAFSVLIVLINAFVTLLILAISRSEKLAWEAGFVWRRIALIFSLTWFVLELLVLIQQFAFDLKDFVDMLEMLSYTSAWYVAACIDPPPKERKEVLRKAFAAG